jgi:hypothetical protein
MTQVSEWGSGMSFVRDLPAASSGGQLCRRRPRHRLRDQQIDIGGVRPGLYRDAVTGGEIHSDGHLSFRVKANSAGIWVLDGPGKIGHDGAGSPPVRGCRPR